jgi:hypothetical protein
MSDSDRDHAAGNRSGLKEPWKPGQSGNPAGRKKGSRHKLSELLLSKLCADFEEHGEAVIKEVREKKPEAYLAAAVAILPKQVEQLESPLSGLTDDELDQLQQYLEILRDSEGKLTS